MLNYDHLGGGWRIQKLWSKTKLLYFLRLFLRHLLPQADVHYDEHLLHDDGQGH